MRLLPFTDEDQISTASMRETLEMDNLRQNGNDIRLQFMCTRECHDVNSRCQLRGFTPINCLVTGINHMDEVASIETPAEIPVTAKKAKKKSVNPLGNSKTRKSSTVLPNSVIARSAKLPRTRKSRLSILRNPMFWCRRSTISVGRRSGKLHLCSTRVQSLSRRW